MKRPKRGTCAERRKRGPWMTDGPPCMPFEFFSPITPDHLSTRTHHSIFNSRVYDSGPKLVSLHSAFEFVSIMAKCRQLRLHYDGCFQSLLDTAT